MTVTIEPMQQITARIRTKDFLFLRYEGINISTLIRNLCINYVEGFSHSKSKKEIELEEFKKEIDEKRNELAAKHTELLQKEKVLEDLQRLKEETKNDAVNISDEMRTWLKSCKNIIKNNPQYVDGRIRLFNNEFGQSLSRRQFLELLEVT